MTIVIAIEVVLPSKRLNIYTKQTLIITFYILTIFGGEVNEYKVVYPPKLGICFAKFRSILGVLFRGISVRFDKFW